MRSHHRRAWAFPVVVFAGALALHVAGVGQLSAPPLTSVSALTAWVDQRSPAAAAIALMRFGAEVVAWYLLALSLLHGLATVPGLAASARLADVLATPATARLVRAGLGMGLAASSVVTSAAPPVPSPAATGAATATMHPSDVSGADAPASPAAADHPGTAAMRPSSTTTAADPAGTAVMRPAAPEASPSPARRPSTWAVLRGQSFWSIATDVLRAELGREPTAAEIDPLWRALVDLNRHRLADPADPDLVFPGQVFEIPAAETRAG